MNTFEFREQIISQTTDEKMQLQILLDIVQEGYDRPEALLMLSSRFIQGMAGGIRDESGLLSHVRELAEVKAYKFSSLMIEDIAFTALNKVRRKYRLYLLEELGLSETRFNNVTIGDEIEERIKNGQYDDEILAEVLPHLERLKKTM